MNLSPVELDMLNGKFGPAVKKSMQILTALGQIYGAKDLIPITSVQVAGVSYDNLGDAGLEFLSEMAAGGGQAEVPTTLNPAGMDLENWEAMGINPEFAFQQKRVIQAFTTMGIIPSCTCTPYLSGNLPKFGDHIAWSESSAVCYANSVIGARTNREGGPSALAASLTGRTPRYGFHLIENRHPSLSININFQPEGSMEFGALGKVLGDVLEKINPKPILLIKGIRKASIEELKSFCASFATYAGAALFHMESITPEWDLYPTPVESLEIRRDDLDQAIQELNPSSEIGADFVSLGCPHLTLLELKRLAQLLDGKKVQKTFWITTSRAIKQLADKEGLTNIIESSGAIFAVDTCCVVAPIKGRFRTLVTDSAKACYYAASKNKFSIRFLPFDQVIAEALR